MGSLIMTVIRIIKFVVDTIADSAKDNEDGSAKCMACVAQLCARCLENLVEYIAKQAYAYQAISGETFCKSAWNGFLLNLKYCAKFYFAITISTWFVAIGIVFVVASNLSIGIILVKNVTKEIEDPEIELYGPFFIYFMMTVLVAIVCLGLFDDAVIAIL